MISTELQGCWVNRAVPF